MENLQEILSDNNFELNEANEATVSYDFANQDEAYDTLFKINQRSSVTVSMVVSPPSFDTDENGNDIQDSSWVVADMFFNVNGVDNDTIKETILSIKSV